MHRKNLTIFLVDDNPIDIEIYRQHLLNSGYDKISVFHDGGECITAISNNPDIIFLDHHLVSYNGIDVLKKIKSYNHNIYVVMLSGDESIEISKNAFRYGAFDYILKGKDDLGKIDATIHKIIRNKQLLY